MSSWDTNPWSNFCDPHWELICHNKWHPGTSEISTKPEIAVGMHFHVQTWHENYPSIFTCWWRNLLVATSKFGLLTIRQPSAPENTYSHILKVTGQVWEGQKRASINTIATTTSINLPKPVSTNLTMKPDSVLTIPTGKDEVQSWL